MLQVERTTFTQSEFAGSTFHETTAQIADALQDALEDPSVAEAIDEANSPRASSAAIQAIVAHHAVELGFSAEKQGLFDGYQTRGLRPDFYRPLGNGSGILLEVERGKTTINNMDLLDFWKCHICREANVLFLFVPTELRQNELMVPRREFNTVSNRLGSFFSPGNQTNVDALYLFGY